MEIIVAVGVFSVLILAVMGIFTSSLRGQQAIIAQARVDREAQLLLQTFTKRIRSSRVDYEAYGGTVSSSENTLSLIDQSDTQLSFVYDSANNEIDVVFDSGSPIPISSGNVSVTNLVFYITPSANPFSPGASPGVQPRVTVVMTLSASEGKTQVSNTIQQTIPQRGGVY